MLVHAVCNLLCFCVNFNTAMLLSCPRNAAVYKCLKAPGVMWVHAMCSCNVCMFLCRNAAAVLRIRRSAIDLEREPDPLDDMRVHPEHYTLAVSVCSKALEGSKRTADDDDDQLVVEQAINGRHRDRVEGLDLAVRPGKSV